MTNVAGNRGPSNGNDSRRSRNTVVNNASKNYPGGFQAPVSSAGAVGYGDQLAASRYQYLAQLAALKQQRGILGQNFQLARQGAKDEAISGMAGAVNSALDSGMLGSSVDAGNRAGVLSQRAAAVAAAQAARTQGRMDLGMQGLDARSQYYMSVSGIQNAMSQEQLVNSINAFGNDQFDGAQLSYKDILAFLRAQKNGNRPGQRSGITSPYAYDPNTQTGGQL